MVDAPIRSKRYVFYCDRVPVLDTDLALNTYNLPVCSFGTASGSSEKTDAAVFRKTKATGLKVLATSLHDLKSMYTIVQKCYV